jgi:hypothetical protein
LVDNNWVHHCTDSGIRCDQCDDVTITNNQVYGNQWWTTSGSSAIVFAEALGDGVNAIDSNVVYGNRNFLPFFLQDSLAHFGSGIENYGQWNQAVVVDGSGVYITRNLDYEGTFELMDNIAYDNGINGLVVHKTTHDNVTVNVERNRIFDNGATMVDSEGRQDAGGLTVNSGDEVSTQTLIDNLVTTDESDTTFQCFGDCIEVAGSSGNTHCGGDVSSDYDADIFDLSVDCTAQHEENQ